MERLTKRLPEDLGVVPIVGYGWSEIAAKLAQYEDAEEQGRLIVLPCKVGEEVFSIEDAAIYCAVDGAEEVDHILEFEFGDCGLTFSTEWYEPRPIEEIGKTVFFSREEAEKALAGEVSK